MNKIDKSIDISVYHMFKNNKSVLTAKTLTKLQKEVKENNEIIKTQQFIIENLKKGVQKLVEASNKKK